MSEAAATVADPRVAQRRAARPDTSVWVAASAGTGKTKVLTDRVLSLLLAGTPPPRILCLTFTKAAAAEMATRLAAELSAWATVEDAELTGRLTALSGEAPDDATRQHARRLFATVLDAPDGIRIQTIHAFCQSLLRRFPLEAGIAPHFTVVEERNAEELLLRAQEEILTEARHGANEVLAAALTEITGHVAQDQFHDLTRRLVAERATLRRQLMRHDGAVGLMATVRRHLGVAPGTRPDDILERAAGDEAVDRGGLRDAAAALEAGSDTDRERGREIMEWLARPDRRVETFERYRDAFLTAGGTARKRLITKAAAAANPSSEDVLRQEAARLEDVVDAHKAATIATATEAILRLGDALLNRYGALKERRALLDYDDLILGALTLLGGGRAAWVLYKLDGGIDHILIDEAQDTNPEQWQIVAALYDEFFGGLGAREIDRTVFAVGDEKQSIFSFQRADPAAFAAMRQEVRRRTAEAEKRWDEVALGVSFRSTRAVLRAVDAVFADATARDGVVAGDTILRHEPFRVGHGGAVEVWPPAAPHDHEAPTPWRAHLDNHPPDSPPRRVAGLIARRIRRWIDDGEMLDSRGRPIRPGDIMILVRRRGGFVDDMVAALKQLGIPVSGVDRMILAEQMAVMDLIAVGRFLLLPQDDLTLAVVLKGPLIGLEEDALFDLAHHRGDRTLWAELVRRKADSQAFARAHDYLAGLLARVDFVPPYELFAGILVGADGAGRRSGRAALLRRLGVEADDAIDEFLSLALSYGRTHRPSLEGFLHWLAAGESEIKRDLEHGARNEVRVMTVHGAKGLQAPIVFLPDTLQVPKEVSPLMWPKTGPPMLWVPRAELREATAGAAYGDARQAQEREYRRLLYVAMTRAEDRLYVCGWHTRNQAPEHCWYNLICRALAAEGSGAAPATFDFAVLSPSGWSGEGWRLRMPQEVPPFDADAAVAQVETVDLPDWAGAPPPDDPEPPVPLTPSRPGVADPAVVSPLGDEAGDAFRRGRLIHRLLQSLPDIDPGDRGAAGRRWLDWSAPDMPAADRAAIAEEVLAVIDAPDIAPAFAAGSLAEVPIADCRPNRRRFDCRPDRPHRRDAGGRPGVGLQERPRPTRGRRQGAGGLSQANVGVSRAHAGDLQGSADQMRPDLDQWAAFDASQRCAAGRLRTLTDPWAVPRFHRGPTGGIGNFN